MCFPLRQHVVQLKPVISGQLHQALHAGPAQEMVLWWSTQRPTGWSFYRSSASCCHYGACCPYHSRRASRTVCHCSISGSVRHPGASQMLEYSDNCGGGSDGSWCSCWWRWRKVAVREGECEAPGQRERNWVGELELRLGIWIGKGKGKVRVRG